MSTCPTNFPLNILTTGDTISDILTPDEMLNLNDPTKSLDTAGLVAATQVLNNKLNEMKQQKFPNAHTFDKFKEDYPNIASRITAADDTDGNNNNLNNISTAEVAIFATETGASLLASDTANGQLTADVSAWNPGAPMPAKVEETLEQMDNFLDDNIGSSLAGGECAAFAAALGTLDALLAKVDGLASSFDDIPAFSLDKYSLKEILSGAVLKAKLQLKAIGGIIKDTVDKVFGKVAAQAASLLKKALDLPAAAMAQVTKAYRKVTDFISDKNKGSIMDGIDKMIAGVSSYFEKFNLDVLARLMFRLCQVASAIQNAAEAPMKSMVNLIDGLTGANKVLKSDSAQHTETAVAAGATRMDPTQVEDKKEEYQDKQREVSADINDMAAAYEEYVLSKWNYYLDKDENSKRPYMSDFLPMTFDKVFPAVKRKKDLPKELREDVDTLKTDNTITNGVGSIIFDHSSAGIDYMGTTIRKGGDDKEEPGPAWTYVKTRLWCQVLSMSAQLGEAVTVLRGFYWPHKNKDVRAGKQIVLKLPSGDLNDYAKYIIAASRAGVKFMAAGYSNKEQLDMLILSNAKGRDIEYIGKTWDDHQLAKKTGLANSATRVEALRDDLGEQLWPARYDHIRNNWGEMYAIAESAPETLVIGEITPEENAQIDAEIAAQQANNPGDGSDANPPKTEAKVETSNTNVSIVNEEEMVDVPRIEGTGTSTPLSDSEMNEIDIQIAAQNKNPTSGDLDNLGFGDAFKAAMNIYGEGNTFFWRGKEYRLETAD